MTVLPAIDPELRPVLARLGALKRSVLPQDIPAMRAGAARFRPDDDALARGGAIQVEETTIPATADQPDLPLLLLRSATVPPPHRLICFLHGGGMVSGDERTGIEVALDWVTALGVCVAAPRYRLAPEHPYPAPVADCLRTLDWLAERRAALDLAAGPPILAGASAGGGLAAAAALIARERGTPALAGLMLLAPMLDDRGATASARAYAGDVPWDGESNATGWAALLGARAGGPDVSATAAPARATDHRGLPPTYLDVGGVETFRDETVAFAERLAEAGVARELHVWEGAFHGFDVIAPETTLARAARSARLAWLTEALRA